MPIFQARFQQFELLPGGLSSLRLCRRGLALVDMLFTLGDAAGF